MTDQQLNILLLGSGGREHALAWKMTQSPLLRDLFIAPGNAGTAALGTNLGIRENDFAAIRKAVLTYGIGMVVVGPEAPLVAGIVDAFRDDPALSSVPVIGPGRAGAMLEGSKDYAKAFMQRHGIPTAAYQTFHKGRLQEAIRFLESNRPPYVLKADGLAAGKGVIICQSLEEAVHGITLMLQEDQFGEAGNKVVIEQYLDGIELSVFILTDGNSCLVLPEAKDYKRIGENDTGPNTGGMGSVSPVPFADQAFLRKVRERVIAPTVSGLASESILYRGFIFFGLMNVGGDPYVIEYNVRLGDPETEVILPRLNNDLVELFLAVAGGKLHEHVVDISPAAAACVMLVAPGYPGTYPKGMQVTGIPGCGPVICFHAGTKADPVSGAVCSAGGRILGLTSVGATLNEALENVYASAEKVRYEGKYYRRDIGRDVLNLTRP